MKKKKEMKIENKQTNKQTNRQKNTVLITNFVSRLFHINVQRNDHYGSSEDV